MLRVSFRANRKISKSFINCFGTKPITIKQVMQNSRRSILKYWFNNIYKYFDARISHGLPITGQLGRSLRINIKGHRLTMAMVGLHNERTKVLRLALQMKMFSGNMNFVPFTMPSFGMGRIVDYDYGKLLRDGVAPSTKGSYSFERDNKSKKGYHPGYDKATRWVPWMDDFKVASRGILASYMIKELQKMGIKPNVKQWRVDINI